MRGVALLLFASALAACGGATSDAGSSEDDFSTADFREDSVLPTRSGWLDAPKALAGVGQFDRLKSTVHDGAKCSAMVAVAAAIIGGQERFLAFLDAVAKKRATHPSDVHIVDAVRVAALDVTLTPRHLHELTEVVVRAFGVENGATDGEIVTELRASGYEPTHVGSSLPDNLEGALDAGDVIPLTTVVDDEGHVMLLWKDAKGVVRIYDSDDVHGSHVMPRGSAAYRKRMDDPQTRWSRGDKYR